jgi:hypothetical protein
MQECGLGCESFAPCLVAATGLNLLAGSTMRSDNAKAKALFRHETFGSLFF